MKNSEVPMMALRRAVQICGGQNPSVTHATVITSFAVLMGSLLLLATIYLFCLR